MLLLGDLLCGPLHRPHPFARNETHQTKRTDLGGKRRGCANLTTGGTEVDDLDLVGVDLRGHGDDGVLRWGRVRKSRATNDSKFLDPRSAALEARTRQNVRENERYTVPTLEHASDGLDSRMKLVQVSTPHYWQTVDQQTMN